MNYSTEQVKELLNIYHKINQISQYPTATIIYLSGDLDSLKKELNCAKEFPKELYLENKNIEETFQRGISLLENAIRLHEEELGLREVKLETNAKPNLFK